MLVTAKRVKDVQVLHVSGHFDQSAQVDLGIAIFETELAQYQHIILDLSQTTSLDSAGLGELLRTFYHLEKRGIQLSLVNPRLDVLEVLTQASLPSTLPIYKSEEEVLAVNHLI